MLHLLAFLFVGPNPDVVLVALRFEHAPAVQVLQDLGHQLVVLEKLLRLRRCIAQARQRGNVLAFAERTEPEQPRVHRILVEISRFELSRLEDRVAKLHELDRLLGCLGER